MSEHNKISELEALVLRLQGDNAALVSEFGHKETDGVVSSISKEVDDAAVHAIKSIVHISNFGDTEALQMSAAKYLVDLKLKLDATSNTGDGAIKKLIERLTATPVGGAEE